MKADDILRAGLEILVERGVQRDQPGGERTIPSVIRAFNALTGHGLTEQQGWLFMALVKIKRSQSGTPDADHYIDGANYFALAGEAALNSAQDSARLAHEELIDLLRCREELQDLARRKSAERLVSLYDAPDAQAVERSCAACDGTGNCAIAPENFVRCPVCGGWGRRYWMDCPDCGGDSAVECPKCHGKGELPVACGRVRGPVDAVGAGS